MTVSDPNEFKFEPTEQATQAQNAAELYSLGPVNPSPQRTKTLAATLNDSLEPQPIVARQYAAPPQSLATKVASHIAQPYMQQYRQQVPQIQ